jgi:hypothetical protein
MSEVSSRLRNWPGRPSAAVVVVAAGLLIMLLPGPAGAFDHSYEQWGKVLAAHTAQGRVGYAELAADRADLDAFIVDCGRVPYADYERWTRQERMAFGINLYNAAMIQLMLNHWPIKSVRDFGFFTSAWNIEFIPLFGHVVSLGNLEHDVLRPSFEDVRIHFAICNSAVSSPALRSTPYLPATLDAELDDQIRVFMTARPECNRFERGTLYLSPLFDWYSTDFGKRTGAITFARVWLPAASTESRVEYTKYDWSLNGR